MFKTAIMFDIAQFFASCVYDNFINNYFLTALNKEL